MSERLQVHLFGRGQVIYDGEPIESNLSDKLMGLLAYLLTAGEPQARTKMAGLLWGDFPEKKAKSNLRTAVYNLGKQIDEYIDSTRKTVAFNDNLPHQADVPAFEEAIAAGDIDDLRRAVGLYTGHFLEGLYIADAPAFEEWLLVTREHLRREMLDALDKLITHDTQHGRYEQAIDYTRRLLSIEPWREESHRQLMILLARVGEYNAALRQYDRCRAVLMEELGVAPMPETKAVLARVQALREAPPKTYLPPTGGPLIGRETETAEVAGMLHDAACRLVTITGPGGIGKTRLAIAVAAATRRMFLDGVYYVSLADLDRPSFVLTAVGQALGVSFEPSRPLPAQLTDYLADKELLLVLDNFETVIDAAAEVARVLPAAPHIKLLITSRQRLALRDEWVFALDGLPFAADDDGEDTSQTAAFQLFVHYAGRVQRGFAAAAHTGAVARVCRLLGGMPLGLELAAAQVADQSVAAVADSLADSLDGLAAEWQDAPPRQRSLRAAFAYSWQRLTAVEQNTLARLAVFRGGFTAAAARQVAETDTAVLTRLVAQSLVRAPADDETAGRYVLHQVVRQFAAAEQADPHSIRTAHMRYFAAVVRAVTDEDRLLTPAGAQTITAEIDNIRAAWAWGCETADFTAVGRMLHELHRFYEYQSWYPEGEALFAQAIAQLEPHLDDGDESDRIVWGRLLAAHAAFLWRMGRIPQGRAVAEQAVDVLRETAGRDELAFAFNILGVLNIYSGDFAAAVEAFERCADIYRADDDARLVKPLTNLGSVYQRMGEHEKARAVMEEGEAKARQIGDKRGRAHFLNNLGALLLVMGRLEEARPYLQECVALCEEIDYGYVQAVAMLNLLEIGVRTGEIDTAVETGRRMLALADELGHTMSLVRGGRWLAQGLHAQDETAEAWDLLRRSLRLGYEAGDMPSLMSVLLGWAILLVAEGREKAAVAPARVVAAHESSEAQHAVAARDLLAGIGVEEGEAAAVDEVVAVLLNDG